VNRNGLVLLLAVATTAQLTACDTRECASYDDCGAESYCASDGRCVAVEDLGDDIAFESTPPPTSVFQEVGPIGVQDAWLGGQFGELRDVDGEAEHSVARAWGGELEMFFARDIDDSTAMLVLVFGRDVDELGLSPGMSEVFEAGAPVTSWVCTGGAVGTTDVPADETEIVVVEESPGVWRYDVVARLDGVGVGEVAASARPALASFWRAVPVGG
jgi:hypothetical protein